MTSRILDLAPLTSEHALLPADPTAGQPPLNDAQPSAPETWASEDLAPRLFAALSAQLSGVPSALLDSSDHARTDQPLRSAHSILAFSLGEHAVTVSHRRGQTSVTSTAGTTHSTQSFFAWLAENWTMEARTSPEGEPDLGGDLPQFALGWVGWLGYELKRESGSPDRQASAVGGERGSDGDGTGRNGLPAQDAALFRATHAVVLHHRRRQIELQCWDPAALDAWQEMVAAALRGLGARDVGAGTGTDQDDADPDGADPDGLDRACVDPGGPLERIQLTDVEVRDSRRDYLAAISRAKREITAGNSYEVCLTTAVTGTLRLGTPSAGTSASTRPRGVEIFTALRTRNRAPFTQFLNIGETEILSTSPERFLSLSPNGTVRSEPIKGTRPRGATAAQDRALAEDLRTHPKDRAENVMIADLVRNDLSIHAIPGTLRTERLCAVESYPSVHQLVSTISARVPDAVPRAQVVADAFPPGSMTGAPKISTMDILQRLETGERGPYSGVAGYFSTNGAADLAVLIRTAVLTGEEGSRRLHLGLGGAITADSDPAEEWEEIRTKSRGVLETLSACFPDEPASLQGSVGGGQSAD